MEMEVEKEKNAIRERMGNESWLDIRTLPFYLIADADVFQRIWDLHPATSSQVMIVGKLVTIPRYQQSYLRDYKFSGVEAKAIPLPAVLEDYLTWANGLGYGVFNQFLVNWYQDGNNYIGSHADSEAQLVANSPVMTITLCQPSEADKKGNTAKPVLRKFRIRDNEKNIVKDIETANGSVIVMGGAFQKEFKHEIVKITGKKAEEVGPRISITLRQFKEDKKGKGVSSLFPCAVCLHDTSLVDPESKMFFCGSACYDDQ